MNFIIFYHQYDILETLIHRAFSFSLFLEEVTWLATAPRAPRTIGIISKLSKRILLTKWNNYMHAFFVFHTFVQQGLFSKPPCHIRLNVNLHNLDLEFCERFCFLTSLRFWHLLLKYTSTQEFNGTCKNKSRRKTTTFYFLYIIFSNHNHTWWKITRNYKGIFYYMLLTMKWGISENTTFYPDYNPKIAYSQVRWLKTHDKCKRHIMLMFCGVVSVTVCSIFSVFIWAVFHKCYWTLQKCFVSWLKSIFSKI